jgi:type IV pilus assembly protein PilF
MKQALYRLQKFNCTACLRLLLATSLLLGISACVTETTGGFNVEVSREKALQDYLALARGYLEQGDLNSAKRHLNNAIDLDRNNAEVHGIWGLVYAREGETTLADNSFQRSLRINSRNSQTRNNYAAFLFANNRYQDAYRQLQIVVDDTGYPARSQAFENLGFAALQLGRMEDAERAFSRAIQLNANQARSSLELASLNLAKQNNQQAAEFYRNYLTLIEFYNVGHNARSLWVGIQLAVAQNDAATRQNLASLLESGFSNSPEYQLYRQFLDDRDND